MQKNILLPQVELEMESVAVVKVCVREGELVDADKPIIEVETQKATTEVPASEAGYVRKLFVKEGDNIGKEALLCILTDTADEAFTIPTSAAAATRSRTVPAPAPASAPIIHEGGIVPAAPAARRAAAEAGIDLRTVRGTGPNGRVTVEDVKAAVDANGKASAPAAPSSPAASTPTAPGGEWIPLPPPRLALIAQMRKSLAEIPQIHVARQMDVTPLSVKAEGVTFSHRLIRAAAAALARHPALRTMIQGERSRVESVSVAVAMDTPHGLVAPAIREADKRQLAEISAAVEDFRRRGASRSLRSEELRNAPFAITNLGMMGVDFFNPFVFHGQTAVLGVARAIDAPAGTKVAWFTLAVDHRVVDGAEAARFLQSLQEEINRA